MPRGERDRAKPERRRQRIRSWSGCDQAAKRLGRLDPSLRYMSDPELQIKTGREQCQLGAGQGCQFLLPLHPHLVLLHLPLLIRQTQSHPS